MPTWRVANMGREAPTGLLDSWNYDIVQGLSEGR